MINNIYQKLTDYLKDCPELGNYIYFNVIPLDVDTASVNSNPASTVLNEYVDGSKEVRLIFNINIVNIFCFAVLTGLCQTFIDKITYFITICSVGLCCVSYCLWWLQSLFSI